MNLKYAQFKKKAGGQVWKIAAFRHNGLTDWISVDMPSACTYSSMKEYTRTSPHVHTRILRCTHTLLGFHLAEP